MFHSTLSALESPRTAGHPKDWTRRYRERLELASKDVQWEDREEVLFWRGSDTGCLQSDVAKENLGEMKSERFCEFWTQFRKATDAGCYGVAFIDVIWPKVWHIL